MAGLVLSSVHAGEELKISFAPLQFHRTFAVVVDDAKPGAFIYRDFPGLMGFIDKTGAIAVQPTYAEVGPFVNGLARAVLDGPCYRLSPEGYRTGSPTTGIPSDYGGAPEAVAACGVRFIGRTGNVAISRPFESARDFQEGAAAVRENGRWGYIDRAGEFLIPPRYAEAGSFREGLAEATPFVQGLAAVRVGTDRISYINTKGRTVFTYDRAKQRFTNAR
jgi:hypothetical protein